MSEPFKIERPYGPDQIIRLHVRRAGGHLKARVWIGQEGSPGLCGELTMRFTDWGHLNRALLDGSESPLAKVGVILEPGLKAWLNANAPSDTIVGTVDEEFASPGAAVKARERAACSCYDGNPANYEGPHADCAIHGAIRAYNEAAREIEVLRALIADLVDDDPCDLDHHGYCQAHSLHADCPHARAKKLLGPGGER